MNQLGALRRVFELAQEAAVGCGPGGEAPEGWEDVEEQDEALGIVLDLIESVEEMQAEPMKAIDAAEKVMKQNGAYPVFSLHLSDVHDHFVEFLEGPPPSDGSLTKAMVILSDEGIDPDTYGEWMGAVIVQAWDLTPDEEVPSDE